MKPSSAALNAASPVSAGAAGAAAAEALRAEFARRIASRLSDGAAALDPEITERLRVARRQALAAAQRTRVMTRSSAGSVQGGGSFSLGAGSGSDPRWARYASLLPLVVMVAGFLMIEYLDARSRVRAAADVDAALLADDLPPTAYSDPGFAEFLRNAPP